MPTNPDDFKYMCCFCGEAIAPTPSDPVRMIVPLPDGGTQEFCCHLPCFRKVLHPLIPTTLLDPSEGD